MQPQPEPEPFQRSTASSGSASLNRATTQPESRVPSPESQVQHFGVTPAAGKVGDMDAIVRELDRAAKVITL
ncbi:MAG: hypothetical protein FJ301_01435 [Planctomycetes bacterium]|nr:hypothetical protein [Planctomycetota bacterium]